MDQSAICCNNRSANPLKFGQNIFKIRRSLYPVFNSLPITLYAKEEKKLIPSYLASMPHVQDKGLLLYTIQHDICTFLTWGTENKDWNIIMTVTIIWTISCLSDHNSALYSHSTEISTSTDAKELRAVITPSLYFSSLNDLGTVSIVSIASESDIDAMNWFSKSGTIIALLVPVLLATVVSTPVTLTIRVKAFVWPSRL